MTKKIFTILVFLGIFAMTFIPPTQAEPKYERIGVHNMRSVQVVIRSCDTPEPSIEEALESLEVMNEWKKKGGMERHSIISVPTYYHIIANDSKGNTQEEANDSITALNIAFKPYFTFNLIETTYTNNPSWFNERRNQMDMKTALRKGGCDALNIYSTSGYNFLGYSSFPNNCGWDSKRRIDDGVVIHYGSVPGGFLVSYNEGDTLVHEVGHWLGLYHTFQGGCHGQGDYCNDTPRHNTNFECSLADTCPLDRGNDPIQNFMNYTPDSCMNEFTENQFERMISQWDKYRNPSRNEPTEAPVDLSTSTPTDPPTVPPTVSISPTAPCSSHERKKACEKASCHWANLGGKERKCFDSPPKCSLYSKLRRCLNASTPETNIPCYWAYFGNSNEKCVSGQPACSAFDKRIACKKARSPNTNGFCYWAKLGTSKECRDRAPACSEYKKRGACRKMSCVWDTVNESCSSHQRKTIAFNAQV